MTDATRLLIVDDSALYRQTISNVLRETDDVDIVGIALIGGGALLASIASINSHPGRMEAA